MALNIQSFYDDFNTAITDTGQNIIVKYWSTTSGTTVAYSGSDYDEPYFLSASGTTVSGLGMFQPVSGKLGGGEFKYLEAGIIKYNDQKLFTHGSLTLQSNSLITDSNGSVWKVLNEPGVAEWSVLGSVIYKSSFVRLINGRLNVI